MNTGVISDEKQLYVRDFETLEKKNAPHWLRQLRQSAMESFLSLKFPTSKDEDWRFTNVAPVFRAGFQTSQDSSSVRPALREIETFLFDNNESSRLVFVNGHFSKELSWIHSSLDGVSVNSFSNLIGSRTNGIEEHLAQYARIEKNIFTALNTAFLNEGAAVFIPEGRVVEKPIHVLFVSATQKEEAYHPRVLIMTGKGSVANIVESYVSLGEESYFSNSVTEIILGEGSILEHCKIQNESERAFHVATTQVHQQRDSSYVSLSVTLGAELSRNELNALLDGVGANCTLNGLYLMDGIQHVDNQTNIDHARPHGTSQELYKGILNGKSRAVFNGRIVVRKDAQKTDARQTNKNLLLSDGARVNTKPQLEILANDVKCNHGATIGHLEEDALFYLKSRGMSDQNARRLLMHGFINDVLIRMKMEIVRKKLDEVLMSRLRKFGNVQRRAS